MRTLRLLPLVGLLACATTYQDLRAAPQDPELEALARQAAELPNTTGRVAAGEAGGRPVELAFRETRAAESEWLVVLLHGVLSDRRTWDYVAGDLGTSCDLLLLDLPGCGESDAPSPRVAGYSPDALGRHVWLALRARLAEREEPARVALVGHSLGAMVILRMMGSPALREEFADVAARVERLVLLSPVDFSVERKHPTFARIAKLKGIEVGIADLLEILEERTAQSALDGAPAGAGVPIGEVERLLEILRDPPRRRAAQAMLVQAVPFTAEEKPDWPRIHELVRDYANVDRPCLVLHGACDETFGVAMGYKVAVQLPDAWLHVLADAKHALPSQEPRRCARAIRGFLADGGRGRVRFLDETFVAVP